MEGTDDPKVLDSCEPPEFPVTLKMEVIEDSYHTDTSDLSTSTGNCSYVKEELEDTDEMSSSVDYFIVKTEAEEHCTVNDPDDDADVGIEVTSNPDSIEDVLMCGVCSTVFQNFCELREHVSTAHIFDSFAASNCAETEIKHEPGHGSSCIASLSRETELACDVCALRCDDWNTLEYHLLIAHRLFTCDDCSENFQTRDELYKHRSQQICERPYRWQCGRCPRKYFQMATLEKHLVRNHRKASEYAREGRRARYNSLDDYRSRLVLGRRKANVELSFKCELCSNSYDTEAPLISHCLNSHQNERNPYGFFVRVAEIEKSKSTGTSSLLGTQIKLEVDTVIPQHPTQRSQLQQSRPQRSQLQQSQPQQSPTTSRDDDTCSNDVDRGPDGVSSTTRISHELIDGSCPCVLKLPADHPRKIVNVKSRPYRCPHCFKCYLSFESAHSHWLLCKHNVQIRGGTASHLLSTLTEPDSPCRVMCAYCAAWLLKPGFIVKKVTKRVNSKLMDKERLRCNACNTSTNYLGFQTHRALTGHHRRFHPEFTARCLVKTCYAVFKHDHELLEHELIAHPKYCKICDEKFATHSALEKHFSSHTDEERYLTSKCTPVRKAESKTMRRGNNSVR